MKILFITAFNPSKNAAGNNYTRQLVDYVGVKNQVDLIIFRNPEKNFYTPTSPNIRVLRYVTLSKAKRICSWLMLPLLAPAFSTRFNWLYVKYIRKTAQNGNYDFIYFDFSQTFVYAHFLSHPQKIFMVHDVLYQKYQRRGLFPKWTKWTEKLLLKKGDYAFTFSKKDSSLLKSLYGVESKPTSFFIQEESIVAEPKDVDKAYFVFFAAWNRDVNYEAFEWFLDNVIDKLPSSLLFKIIGKGMPERLVERTKRYKNVDLLGFVDNPYNEIANAKALISPLHDGAGVKVKVIEALACGTPVIGTSISFEGIDDQYSSFMHLAESPEQYVYEILNLHVTIEEKKKFKQFFLESYNDKPILKLFDA